MSHRKLSSGNMQRDTPTGDREFCSRHSRGWLFDAVPKSSIIHEGGIFPKLRRALARKCVDVKLEMIKLYTCNVSRAFVHKP